MERDLILVDISSNLENNLDESVEGNKNGTKRRAKVMDYFTKVAPKELVCNLCDPRKRDILKKNKHACTSPFWRHLQKHHPKVHNELKNVSGKQKPVIEAVENVQLKKQIYVGITPEEVKKELLRYICLSNSPWSVVERHYFIRLLQFFAQRDLDIPSIDVVCEYAKVVYDKMQSSLRQTLAATYQVSITVNAWTSENNIALLGITVHWVDSDWVLCDRTLAIHELVERHTGENMCDIIIQVLKEFNIESKLCSVTTDSATNNKKMMHILAEQLAPKNPHFTAERHVPCLAHVINLVVQAGLRHLHVPPAPLVLASIPEVSEFEDNQESKGTREDISEYCSLGTLGEAVARVRELVTEIRVSTQHTSTYTELCKTLNIGNRNKLPLDCPTRWNSMHAMLVAAVEKRELLHVITTRVPELRRLHLSNNHWEMICALVEVLKPMRDATLYATTSTVPSVTDVLAIVKSLAMHINAMETKFSSPTTPDDQFSLPVAARLSLSAACGEMKSKLSKYVLTLMQNQAVTVAAFLDPTTKLKAIDEGMHDQVKSYLIGLMEAESAPGGSIEREETRPPADTKGDFIALAIKSFKGQPEETPISSSKGELEAYLMAPYCTDNSPLGWWKYRGKCFFPKLARIAMGFLSTSATSVPSERVFSVGRGIISDRRSRLDTKNIEHLMTLKCWLRADEGEEDYKDCVPNVDNGEIPWLDGER